MQISHAELKTHLPCHEGPYGEIEHGVIFLNNAENQGHISDAAKSCHDCIQLVARKRKIVAIVGAGSRCIFAIDGDG